MNDAKISKFTINEYTVASFECRLEKHRDINDLKNYLKIFKPKKIQFESTQVYHRFLRLLPQVNLDETRYYNILSTFRNKLGLPFDLFDSNVTLISQDGSLFQFSEQLMKICSIEMFATLLNSDFTEGQKKEIKLPLSGEAIKNFLVFFYTGKVQQASIESLKELLNFAKMISETELEAMTRQTIFDYFFDESHADQFDEELIRGYDYDFVKKYLIQKNAIYEVKDFEWEFESNSIMLDLQSFIVLFSKESKVCTFILEKINNVKIDLYRPIENYTEIFLLPQKYRRAISYLQISGLKMKHFSRLRLWFPNAEIVPPTLKKFVQHFPTKESFAYHFAQGLICLQENNDLTQAQQFFEPALICDDKNASVHAYLGEIFLKLNEPGQAASSLQKALELDPKSALAYRVLGELLLKQGKINKAERNLRKALKINPKSVRALCAHCQTLIYSNKYEEAKVIGLKALKLNGVVAYETHLLLCQILIDLNRHDEAESYAKQAFEITPKSPYCLIALYETLKLRSKFPEAEELFKKLDLHPNSPFVVACHAKKLIEEGKYLDAAEWEKGH